MKRADEERKNSTTRNRNSGKESTRVEHTDRNAGRDREYYDDMKREGRRRDESARESDLKRDRRPEGRREAEMRSDRRPEGRREAEMRSDRRPEGRREAEMRGDRRPEGRREAEMRSDRRPEGRREPNTRGDHRREDEKASADKQRKISESKKEKRKKKAVPRMTREEWLKQREKEMEERAKLRRTNKEIIFVSYLFIILFVCMIGYLGVFLQKDADAYRNNSYNARRQSLLEEKYIRGDIQASDGTVLATTEVNDEEEEVRVYPEGRTFAHVVGYANKGVTGLEASAGSYVLSTHENLLLRVLDELRGEKSRGDTVRTTLNADLQKAAWEALGDQDGAVVVLEPSTGRILAMVSKPDFDPNTLAENYDNLINDDSSNGILVNRATQGLYTPGSTFKILTALEFIREYPSSWDNFSFFCNGVYSAEDYQIQCSSKKQHGTIDLKTAFAESCNGAFAEIGQQLNFGKFYDLCGDFGFNRSISGVSAANSVFTLNNNNSLWKILQTSIGQGETQVTPLLNAMIAASVANDGVMMKPRLLDSIRTSRGNTVEEFSSSVYSQVMSKEEADILEDMMKAVVEDGTGSEAAGSGYWAAGKTGSAERSKDKATDAWFVGYAVSEEDSSQCIAVSIVVEEAGGGGSVAAPIARDIFEAYFE